ncbi:MAG TPA: LPXTG cell wall anchor domain-containing protein [Nitriliruptorales bacterium]
MRHLMTRIARAAALVALALPLTASAASAAPGSDVDVDWASCSDVSVSSDKDISNVVLGFGDGDTERFEEGDWGNAASFSGTGEHAGETIATVWVKAGDNHSGDGPGYGERFDHTVDCDTEPSGSQSQDSDQGSGSQDAGSEGSTGDGSGSDGSGSQDADSEGSTSDTSGSDGSGSDGSGSQDADSEGSTGDTSDSEDTAPEDGGSQDVGSPDTTGHQAGDVTTGTDGDPESTTAPGLDDVSDDADESAEVLDASFDATTTRTAIPQEGPATQSDDEITEGTQVLGVSVENSAGGTPVAAAGHEPVEVSPSALPRTGANAAHLALAALTSLTAGGAVVRRRSN